MWCIILVFTVQAQEPNRIDLSGTWRFQLDPIGFGKTPGSELYLERLVETIVLPGSTDQGGKGIKNNARYVDRLSRKFEYQGAAWYQRELVIPSSWIGKDIFLHLERCHWETSVYIDGRLAGTDERLSTPNLFDVTRFMSAGVHTITLCVDNRLKYPMDQWTHGTSEYTQTNWNGIVGNIVLLTKEKTHIRRVNVYPDIERKQARIRLQFSPMDNSKQGKLDLMIREKSGRVVASRSMKVDSLSVSQGVEAVLPMGKISDCGMNLLLNYMNWKLYCL